MARAASTSASTVSRYLNGFSVRPETAAAIDRAVLESDYHVNAHARSLRTSRANSVGLLFPRNMESVFTDPVLAVISTELVRAFGRRGRSVTMLLADSADDLRRTLSYVRGQHVDGLVVANPPDESEQLAAELDSLGIPIVVAGLWPQLTHASAVYSDTETGVADAVRYLLAHGRSRVGYLCGKDEAHGGGRREGHRLGMGEHFAPDLVVEDWPPGGPELRDLLARGVDAVVAYNDVLAVTVINTLLALGVRVPEDVAVVGVDNLVAVCEASTPTLTSVSQDFTRMARELVRVLDAQLEGASPIVSVIPTHLALRQSA